MEGYPLHDRWVQPPVFIFKPLHFQPLHEAGDFYQFGGGGLITNPRATEALYSQLAMGGELLPLPHEGVEYTLFNCTECINCLDQERSEWLVTAEGERVYPTRYVFHLDRFTESNFFKIPETRRAELLVVEGLRDPEDEFRAVAARAGLRGLRFEELWSSGS